MGGAVRCLELLVGLGMALDRKQRNGHAAIHKAAGGGHAECCRWLLGNSTADQLANVARCAAEETHAPNSANSSLEGALSSVASEDGDGVGDGVGDGEGGLDSGGGDERRRALQRQRETHLPSSLALRNGHTACAVLLRAACL